MKAETLLSLELPEDTEALAQLPPPEGSAIVRLGRKRLMGACEHFRRLWLELCSGEIWEQSDTRPDDTYLGGSGGLWTVLLKVGSYYGFCIYRYASKAGPDAAKELLDRIPAPPHALAVDLEDVDSGTLTIELMRLNAQVTLKTFDTAALGVLLAEVLDAPAFESMELGERFDPDLRAIEAIAGMQAYLAQTSGQVSELVTELVTMTIAHRLSAVEKRGERRREEAESSHSLVKPSETVLLSGRNKAVVRKYGEKRVERVFEQQIGLMFNRLGFVVVPARPGEAEADLLCIAPQDRFSFLVDAKTSAKPYALPRDDQRALADYVVRFGGDLPALPPLAFLLLVGPSGAAGLEDKLVRLSVEIGVPVRFIQARALADLYTSVAGPVLAKAFREQVVTSGPIVDGDSLVDASKEAFDGITSAYATFVRSLRAVG